MKFKVARADRGWKIFVGLGWARARASPGGRLSANSRNEFQLVDRRKMAPGYPAAAGLPGLLRSPISSPPENWQFACKFRAMPRPVSTPAASSLREYSSKRNVSWGYFDRRQVRITSSISPPLLLQRFIGSWSDCLWFELL